MIITYDPTSTVNLTPDNLIYNKVVELVRIGIDAIVCQELIVLQIRVFIVKGITNNNNIKFKFKDNIIQVDKYGTLSDFPIGFCDISSDLLYSLCFD